MATANRRSVTRAFVQAIGLAALIIFLKCGASASAASITGTDHWAFKPLSAPPVPACAHDRWVRSPVDAFILDRLIKEGLGPSPPADRRTLIRRLFFDLTGLPPTPRDIDAFVDDPDPAAYEKLVDRLLDSPRYGERWARHWLDVVRFAESNGFEMNQPRPNAWHYRDYVIRSFNSDKPYDQFVREQLAGDALGADEATGYLVGGAWDEVKSPDPNLTAQQRMDELHDMVATTGATFLGLTVGCARCHDHKFDPISQIDYYRMQAIFAGVEHGERRANSKGYDARLQRLALARQQLDAKLAQFEKKATLSANPARSPIRATRNVERFDPIAARFVRLTIRTTNGAEPCIDELEIYAAGEPTRNVALTSAGGKATASSLLPSFAIHRVEHLNDGLYGNDHSWISNERGKGWVQIELPRQFTIDTVVWGRDRDGKFNDRVPTQYSVEVATEPGAWHVVATSSDRVVLALGAPWKPVYEASSARERAALAKLLDEDRALDEESKKLAAEPVLYAGVFTQPPPTHRLYRGEAMQPREVVAPGGISFLAPELDLAPDTPEQQRRLALANWITDPRNPLTARVIVNRLWQYHFGHGIVETPSDFGHAGARPTHGELLDWLVTQLIANQWKLKPINRLIVLSATYRQSSRLDAHAASIDGGSTLLWRFPPRRLEAEEIRDAVLAVSGKLDLAMGGPGFDVFKPNSNYVRIYTPKDDFGPAEWRRMIYQFKPRLQQDGTFGVFDCPDGGQTMPKRASSTTPLQALNLLNSRLILRQAAFFAERVKAQAGDDPTAQATYAFRLAFGRNPSETECRAAVDVIGANSLDLLCRTLFNANEFVYVF